MIGYTERATRCNGSRSRIECSSTPAPSSGYMFWIAPIHTPIIPVRRSPKYFQVSESGPSGRPDVAGAAWGEIDVVVIAGLLLPIALTITLTTHVVYDFRVLRAFVLRTERRRCDEALIGV